METKRMVKRAQVVREFLQQGGKAVPVGEFAEFWKVCDEATRKDYSEKAAEALGVGIEGD